MANTKPCQPVTRPEWEKTAGQGSRALCSYMKCPKGGQQGGEGSGGVPSARHHAQRHLGMGSRPAAGGCPGRLRRQQSSQQIYADKGTASIPQSSQQPYAALDSGAEQEKQQSSFQQEQKIAYDGFESGMFHGRGLPQLDKVRRSAHRLGAPQTQKRYNVWLFDNSIL